MLKIKVILIGLFLFGTFFVPDVLAENVVDPDSEYIKSYDVVMNVNPDSSIDASETIAYNYDGQAKAGFSRFLPIKYQDLDGTNFEAKYSHINVADENGNPYKFETAKQENKNEANAYLEIKIGDPNQIVAGTKIYVIKYHLRNAIKYFSDHDQLFWNITGKKWPVYVKYPTVKIYLPQKVDREEISKDCFIGIYAATVDCIDRLTGRKKDPNAHYSYKGVVSGEGMTVIFGFPKGIANKPTNWQNFEEDMIDNWTLIKSSSFLLILFFAGLAFLIAVIIFIIIFQKKIAKFFAGLKNKIFKNKVKEEKVDDGIKNL
jgi:hypothetical protein